MLIDNNPEAVQVAAARLAEFRPELEGFTAMNSAVVQAALF